MCEDMFRCWIVIDVRVDALRECVDEDGCLWIWIYGCFGSKVCGYEYVWISEDMG